MFQVSSVEHSLRPGSHSPETSLLAAAKREPFCLSVGHTPSDEFELSSLKQSPLSVSSDLSMSSPDGVGSTRSDADPLLDTSLSDLEPAFYPMYSLSVPPFESPRVPSSVDDSPRVSYSVGDAYSASVYNEQFSSVSSNRLSSVNNDQSSLANSDQLNPANNNQSSLAINNRSTHTTNPLPFPSNRIPTHFHLP